MYPSPQSAGCFFHDEVHGQSSVSDMESDTDKTSTDGASGLLSSASPAPESLIHAPTDVCDPPIETLKPHITKVTSDSFISELVFDREPASNSKESRPAGPTVPGEENTPGKVKSKEQHAVIPVSQSVGSDDPQWGNVDLAEAQGQQMQAEIVQDSVDTCSLSSVATYCLAIEDPYGVDEHPMWAWVSGGGCDVVSHSQLNWFNSLMTNSCELNYDMTLSHSVKRQCGLLRRDDWLVKLCYSSLLSQRWCSQPSLLLCPSPPPRQQLGGNKSLSS